MCERALCLRARAIIKITCILADLLFQRVALSKYGVPSTAAPSPPQRPDPLSPLRAPGVTLRALCTKSAGRGAGLWSSGGVRQAGASVVRRVQPRTLRVPLSATATAARPRGPAHDLRHCPVSSCAREVPLAAARRRVRRREGGCACSSNSRARASGSADGATDGRAACARRQGGDGAAGAAAGGADAQRQRC